jgi:hypothetical protein
MTDGAAGGLGALIEMAIADFSGVDRHDRGADVEWSAEGIVFASLNGDRAEFRLARPVVEAALRTPGTERSARGPDWVAFAPVELDRQAIDRAEAWLASAWRRARDPDDR